MEQPICWECHVVLEMYWPDKPADPFIRWWRCPNCKKVFYTDAVPDTGAIEEKNPEDEVQLGPDYI